MRSVQLVAIGEADKTQAGLLNNLLVRVLEKVLQVWENILGHGNAILVHSSAAVCGCLHCRALNVCREKVEIHQDRSKSALLDDSMWVL
jgi:hypothetical protein